METYLQLETTFKNKIPISFANLSTTSIYLDPELTQYLKRILAKEKRINQYFEKLIHRYKFIIPKHLPKNPKLKRKIQKRIANRTRFSFRPSCKNFCDLQMLSKATDLSFGYIIAVMIDLDRRGMKELLKKFFKNVVITAFSPSLEPQLTLKYDSNSNILSKNYLYGPREIKLE